MAHEFVDWAKGNGMMIQYIEPGEPNQNAYIERFNRTYRDEVLDLYLFETLEQVRESRIGGSSITTSIDHTTRWAI